MYISKEYDRFVVPVKYVDSKELGIVISRYLDVNTRSSKEDELQYKKMLSEKKGAIKKEAPQVIPKKEVPKVEFNEVIVPQVVPKKEVPQVKINEVIVPQVVPKKEVPQVEVNKVIVSQAAPKKETSKTELDMIKVKMKSQMDTHWIKVKEFSKILTSDQLLNIHINVLKDVWMNSISNNPCLEKMKQKGSLNKIIQSSGDNFKKAFKVNCDKFKGEKIKPTVTEKEVEIKCDQASMEVEYMCKDMMKMLDNLSEEQVMEIHKFISDMLAEGDVENDVEDCCCCKYRY